MFFRLLKNSFLCSLVLLPFWQETTNQIHAAGKKTESSKELPVKAEIEAPELCQNFSSQDLAQRVQTLKKLAQSLDVALGQEGVAGVDLNVLFQIDVSNSDARTRRIQELEGLVDANQVQDLNEFVQFRTCAKSIEEKSALAELAQIQAEINSKKLLFLKLEDEKRSQLISAYETLRSQNVNQQNLEQKLKESTAALSEAQSNLRETEQQTTDATSKNIEPILSAQTLLEKSLVELEDEQIKFISFVQSNLENLAKLHKNLANVVVKLNTPDSKDIERTYGEIIVLWRIAADDLLTVYRSVDISFGSALPQDLELKPRNEEESLLLEKYRKGIEQYKERREALTEQRLEIVDQWKAQSFHLLSETGQYRVQAIEACDQVSCDRPRGLNYENILDIYREIKLIPLKILSSTLTKWMETKSKFKAGFDGWLDLGKQLFSLILLLLIPIAFFKGLNLVSHALEGLRSNILMKSMLSYRKRTYLAIWISRLNPFIPFLGMILAINAAILLIEGTELRDFTKLLSYVQIYYFYRICRLIITYGLNFFATVTNVEHIRRLKNKIEESARVISRLIFIEYLVMVLIEDSARRALAFSLVSNIIFLVNIYFLLKESHKWKTEILSVSDRATPKLLKVLDPVVQRNWGVIFLPCLLLASLGQVVSKELKSYLIGKEFTKWILSEILRKKLELSDKAEVEKPQLPESYLKLYNFYTPASPEIFIDRDDPVTENLVDLVQKWKSKRTADDLAIVVGNRGMGKTTVIFKIHSILKENIECKLSNIPGKICDESAFYAWLSAFLEYPILSVNDITRFDDALKEPLVLLVDDIHNLFLSRIGGFQAYNLLLQILGLQTQRIFWCLTIGSRSWSFLKGVYGGEHFYGKILILSSWKDYEIQRLITVRHAQSGLDRKFDNSIKAYGTSSAIGEQAETQFFRLLWGQSRGNPRSALMYWVSAISQHPKGYIDVGVPSFINSAIVSSLSDDSLFVLAALSRHGNLTWEELQQVTNISIYSIRRCLKECEDKKLIWLDDIGRYRISSRAQYVVDYYLMGKNFLYE